MDLPCRADPDRWFSRDFPILGGAIHGCLRHCPWLQQCRAEPPTVDGVIGGVLYTRLGVPHHYQPEEVACPACVPPARQHGTDAGYSRHRRRGEQPCMPCRNAHNEAVKRWKKSKPPVEPAVEPARDIYEERRRVLCEALTRRRPAG